MSPLADHRSRRFLFAAVINSTVSPGEVDMLASEHSDDAC